MHPAPTPSTHAVVQLTMNGSAVEAGTLPVTHVHDRLEAIANESRAKHVVGVGAHAKLAFDRKGALQSAVVGVTVVESSGSSEDAIACVRDGMLAAHLVAEAGTFDGAVLEFE